MITTNTRQPKEDHSFDKFMEDVRDEAGQVIAYKSSIPRHVITTSSMKPRPEGELRADFPNIVKRDVRKVDPKVRFNTESLQDVQKKLAREARVAQVTQATPAPDAPKPARAAKAPARKKKA